MFAGLITLFGSQRLLSKFSKLCRQHEEDPSVVASTGFLDLATKALGPRFHGYMTSLHHNPGLRTQRFFMTFMARYHGLSVLGGDLLSPMGMMMPSSTYDAMLKTVVDIGDQRALVARSMKPAEATTEGSSSCCLHNLLNLLRRR